MTDEAVLLDGTIAAGFWRSDKRLPQVPAGDIEVSGDRAARSAAIGAKITERVDDSLREWPMACLSLLFVVFLFAAALWTRS